MGATIGAGTLLLAGEETLQTLPRVFASVQVPQTALSAKDIPMFVEALPTFYGKRVLNASYTVSMYEFQQKILPDKFYAGLKSPYRNGTYLWGYKVDNRPIFSPGYTVEAFRNRPTTVTYVNNLPFPAHSRLELLLTDDQTLHWADPLHRGMSYTKVPYKGPIPVSVHLHGGETPSAFDGTPNQWFTRNGLHGKGYATLVPIAPNSAVYRYPNPQEAATLFFHDHALGITRLNIYAGLVAGYLVRDQYDTGLPDNPLGLPSGPQEVELIVQDKQFDTNGQLLFPDGCPSGLAGPPPHPDVHPYWIPQFVGDVITVNGKSWPYFNVEPRRYRFRFVNGANARAFRMYLEDAETKEPGPTMWQIGTDGGLLDYPVQLDKTKNALFLASAERADVIVDFSEFAGRRFTLMNDYAPPPFPLVETASVVMRFNVNLPLSSPDATYNPANGGSLRGGRNQPPPIVRLANPLTGTLAAGVKLAAKRQLVLVSFNAPEKDTAKPLEVLVNNTKWDGLIEGTHTPVSGSRPGTMKQGIWLTELPAVGATEVWEIINLSGGSHPMHIHLIQFQVLNRQEFELEKYRNEYASQFPGGEYIGASGSPLPYNVPNEDGAIGGNPAVSRYLEGEVIPPAANEAGWKDTVFAPSGVVTRLVARWTPLEVPVNAVKPGQNLYSFDPTVGPGYVWHCHIIDHEDNEMMRPYSPVWYKE